MALLTLTNAHLAYGHVPLLDGTDFALEAGERVALIGRNGTGKSSLLKILAGLEKPDDGLLQTQTGLRRVYVAQEPVFEPRRHRVRGGGRRRGRGARAARSLRGACAARRPRRACRPQIEALDGWTWEQRVRRSPAAPAPGCRGAGSMISRAAPRSASRWRRRWWPHPTCCCSTSRPTTWTSMPSSGCRACSSAARALVLVSHDRAFIDARGHAHRRARPRPAAQLPRQLRRLQRSEGTRARERSPSRGTRRQAARARRSLDPQGRRGAAHPQRGAGRRG